MTIYWVSPWLKALLVALVVALVVLATEAVFGWAGKVLVVAWKVIVKFLAVFGIVIL